MTNKQTPKGHYELPRDAAQISRRLRRILDEQGHAVTLIVFGVVLLFICLPVFLVDDLLYVHTTKPEYTLRNDRIAVEPVITRHNHTRLRHNVTLRKNSTLIPRADAFPATDDDEQAFEITKSSLLTPVVDPPPGSSLPRP